MNRSFFHLVRLNSYPTHITQPKPEVIVHTDEEIARELELKVKYSVHR